MGSDKPGLFGVDLFGAPVTHPQGSAVGALAKRFVAPPMTVLNARDGAWQARKRAWEACGIRGEVGRSAKAFNIHEWSDENGGPRAAGDGTSIFDPALTELCYAWFAPPGGHVLDPFAGGSVRGIVAALMGFRYTGIDLRAEQVAANQGQAAEICAGAAAQPHWITGDADGIEAMGVDDADFLFSCPPYGDLEKYSDDQRDLSAMSHESFCAAYSSIITKAVARLRPDRFACFVVGDFRDKRGIYRNFVSSTITAFQAAGAELYNEAILVTSTGSLPVRVAKQFTVSRKLGKSHQNVLVFIKGDPRKAAAACCS